MLTVKRLFRKRLADHWNYQIGVVRTVVDWIIALYLIMPALAIGAYQYYRWWQAEPPWIAHVPLLVIAFALFFFTTSGTVRLFVEEGDQLFMLQRDAWFRGVMRRGIGYTIACHGLLSAAAIALLAPLLHLHYGWSFVRLIAFALFVWLFRVDAALIVRLLAASYSGWRYWLRYALLLPLFAILFVPAAVSLPQWPLALIAASLLLAATAAWLAKLRLDRRGAFFHDVEYERTQRMRIAAFVVRDVIERKPRARRMRPLLWRRSNRLFRKRTPANGLAETCVKSFYRSWPQGKLLLRALPLGVAALSLPFMPVWVKGVLWACFAVMLANWLKAYWKEHVGSEFVRLFPWSDADKREAGGKAILSMLLPIYMPMCLAFGISSFPWYGAVVVLAAGWGLAHAVSRWLMQWG